MGDNSAGEWRTGRTCDFLLVGECNKVQRPLEAAWGGGAQILRAPPLSLLSPLVTDSHGEAAFLSKLADPEDSTLVCRTGLRGLWESTRSSESIPFLGDQ